MKPGSQESTGEQGAGPAPADGIALSLIVPTLNEEANLPRLLDATLSATDPLDRPTQIVVADGGSGDSTRQLASDRGCDVVRTERGRGHQLAAGAARARCEILIFLHADALPYPGALRSLRVALQDPAIEACSFAQVIDADGRFYRLVERTADRRARRGWVYGDSGLALRRSTYDAIGGFSRQPLFEDLDLSKRLRQRTRVLIPEGARIGVSPRRWQREGALWTTVRNWTLTHLWRAGIPPRHLQRFYPPACRGSVQGTAKPDAN
ncbi:MAG: rSAM/selenodomain-associated transferase 2 [Planctomycetota bacterium]|jgi:rSAM/selenodomain-associated transferase 2